MNEVKWIKIVTDIFNDEKILLIDSLPDGDTILVIWFKLLCLAGKQNNGGVIMMNDRIPYTEEMLSTVFRRNLNTVRLALKTFEEFGMIEIINGAVCISNWSKHQNMEGMEKVREQTRRRVAKYKEKQKNMTMISENNVSGNVSGNVKLTLGNDIDKEEDIEKEKEEENIYCPSDDGRKPSEKQIEEWFEACWDAYPKKQGRKKAYAAFKNSIKHGAKYEDILSGTKRYADHVFSNRTSYEFIKQGSTFFFGECWNDDYGNPANNKPDYSSQSDVADFEI